MRGVLRRVAMHRPDHDVRNIVGRIALEQGLHALGLKVWRVDEHLVQDHVVRLAGHILGLHFDADRGGPGGEELDAVDGLEAAGGKHAVAEHDGRQPPRVARRHHQAMSQQWVGRRGGPVGGRTQYVPAAVRIGLRRQLRGRVAGTAQIERVGERARHRAGQAHRIASDGRLRVIVRVLREAGVGATVVGRTRAAGAALDRMPRRRVVHSHHDPGGRVVGVAIQAKVTLGVVNVRDVPLDDVQALLEEHVASNNARTYTVCLDHGERAVAAQIALVELGQAALTIRDTGSRCLGKGLLQSQAVGRVIHQQVARQNHVLPADHHRASGPDVGRVIQSKELDLADDRHRLRGDRGRLRGGPSCLEVR